MTKTIKHTLFYSHPVQDVWEYLTNPELIKQWLMESDLKPEVGHEFKFTTKPMPQYGFNGVIYCKVLEVVPNKKLVYSWKGGPGDGAAFTLDSVVTWTLTAKDNGTELQLEHSGFTEANAAAFTTMDMGWQQNIQRIADVFALVKHKLRFSQSPKEVWEYITRPELLEQWFTKTDIKPVVGQKFHFFDKTGKVVDCEVLEASPFTKFSYSWQYASAKDGKRYDSKVVWTLVPIESGTELQLTHTGFTALEDVITHTGGWTRLGVRLTELLKTAKV